MIHILNQLYVNMKINDETIDNITSFLIDGEQRRGRVQIIMNAGMFEGSIFIQGHHVADNSRISTVIVTVIVNEFL